MIKEFYWHTGETRTGTTIPSQSGPGSDGNEQVLHDTQNSKTEALLS